MYELENCKPFRPKKHNNQAIQNVFPTQDFSPLQLEALDNYWKFVVVRDPAKRIISAYTNKMSKWYPRIERRMKSKDRSQLLDDGILDTIPTINEFLLLIEPYRRQFVAIKHHTDSFSTFLGTDLTVFNKIYPIEQIEQLRLDINHRIGTNLEFRHANRSSVVIDPITPVAFQALMDFCRADYDQLAEFYSAPEAIY